MKNNYIYCFLVLIRIKKGLEKTSSRQKFADCQFEIVVLYDLKTNSATQLEHYTSLTLDLVGHNEIGANATRFALVRFAGAGRAETIFSLKKHESRDAIVGGQRETALAGGQTLRLQTSSASQPSAAPRESPKRCDLQLTSFSRRQR